MGGLAMLLNEVEATKYQQTLLYDAESGDMVQPGAAMAPANSGDSSSNDDTH
jgi:hypothetical protein